ncbi:MAG TPA: hypothetical protein VHL11_04425, partial [Phototrophicaceae bacterium]|nr:hypothetical protein [Phototrophicaceae bacterium]
MRKQFVVAGLLLILGGLLAIVFPASADHDEEPSVTVTDQAVTDGWVTIGNVVSAGPGFLVVHKDDGNGAIGAGIGFR